MRRAAIALAVLGVAASVIFLSGTTLCPIARVTHHPCPGCGLTRAVVAALHGDLRGSFHHHPLALLMAPLIAVVLLRHATGYVLRGAWGEADAVGGKWVDRALIALAVLMLGVWIARFFGLLGGPEPVG
ncbi:MAG: hypothetical protein NVSMB47_13890 [Polyangiales bacterium]